LHYLFQKDLRFINPNAAQTLGFTKAAQAQAFCKRLNAIVILGASQTKLTAKAAQFPAFAKRRTALAKSFANAFAFYFLRCKRNSGAIRSAHFHPRSL